MQCARRKAPDHRNLNPSRFNASDNAVRVTRAAAPLLACVLIGSVADLTLHETKHEYRHVQGSNLTMENAIGRELDSTLTASWCAANLIRLNLEKLNCIADPPKIGRLIMNDGLPLGTFCSAPRILRVVDAACMHFGKWSNYSVASQLSCSCTVMLRTRVKTKL